MTPPAVELRRLSKTYREGDSERVVFLSLPPRTPA